MGSEIQDDCDLPRYAELIDAWRRSKPLGSIEPSVSWVALARAGFRQAPAPFEKRPPSVGGPLLHFALNKLISLVSDGPHYELPRTLLICLDGGPIGLTIAVLVTMAPFVLL